MQSWWMMAIRGGFGILLGLAVLLWPGVELGEAVILEGVVSVALGVVALGFPFESARVVHVIAVWGLVTGMLEILAAVRLPRGVTGHWFLAAGGAWSIFLAVLILSLPYALTEDLVNAIGVYALVFGVLVSIAAFMLRNAAPPILLRRVNHTWMTR